jgi:hypothetical protein
MHRNGLMAPPEDPERRPGLMAADPEAEAAPVSLHAFLWAVAVLLAVVELALEALAT